MLDFEISLHDVLVPRVRLVRQQVIQQLVVDYRKRAAIRFRCSRSPARTVPILSSAGIGPSQADVWSTSASTAHRTHVRSWVPWEPWERNRVALVPLVAGPRW